MKLFLQTVTPLEVAGREKSDHSNPPKLMFILAKSVSLAVTSYLFPTSLILTRHLLSLPNFFLRLINTHFLFLLTEVYLQTFKLGNQLLTSVTV